MVPNMVLESCPNKEVASLKGVEQWVYFIQRLQEKGKLFEGLRAT